MSIHELFDRFPSLPKSAVIKAELLVRGMKMGRSLAQAIAEYRLAAGSRPDATPPLKIDNVYIDIRPADDSPYEVVASEEGLLLTQDGQVISMAELPKPSVAMGIGNASGIPFAEIASLSPVSKVLTIQLLSGCQHALDDLACSFCSRTKSDQHLDRSQEKMKLEVFSEVTASLLNSGQIHGVMLTGGSLRDLDEEAVWLCEAVSRLRTVLPKDKILISASSQPLEPRGVEALAAAGLDQLDECVDVLNPASRARDIAGKHRSQLESALVERGGYSNLIDAAEASSDRLGTGALTTSFIAGAEMIASPDVGPTISLENEMEAVTALLGAGSMPRPIVWTPTEGSKWAADNKHLDQAPDSSYHLELAKAIVEAVGPRNRDQLALSLRPDVHFHGLGIGDFI